MNGRDTVLTSQGESMDQLFYVTSDRLLQWYLLTGVFWAIFMFALNKRGVLKWFDHFQWTCARFRLSEHVCALIASLGAIAVFVCFTVAWPLSAARKL
jgi:uncharacterized membrane protein YidH (DUF202 family)